MRSVIEVNPIVLAYLGDSIYEYCIRRYLIENGFSNVKDLQEQAVFYVSAKAQREKLMYLLENKLLTEEEIAIMKRARNSKVNHHLKNCDVATYNYATGLEAIFGYLDLINDKDRIEELISIIVNI